RCFDHVDDQHHLVGLRAWHGGDIDGLEEAEIVEAALGPRNHDLVEGVALAHVELAADDIVTRTIVAADLDALDIGANTLVDRIDHGNRPVGEITVAARRYFGERIAAASQALGQPDDRGFHILGAVDVAGPGIEFRL